MNKQRIEELVSSVEHEFPTLDRDALCNRIRAALLTLAEECFEKAAKVCDGHENDWIRTASSPISDAAVKHYGSLAAGAGSCARLPSAP